MLKLKKIIASVLGKLAYYFNIYFKKNKRLKVYSIDETLESIIKHKYSVVRFGDGELTIVSGKSIKFQNYNKELAESLMNIMALDIDGLIICVPDVFGNLGIYTERCQSFWRYHLLKFRKLWYACFDSSSKYHNAFISRLYMEYQNKEKSVEWFNAIKKIWKDKEIIIIEGEFSRLGVNNDLFKGAKSIERILAPSINAFDKLDLILEEALKVDKRKLILVALGPTAKIVTYELFMKGYQCIDIGHIDIEYEWYLAQTTTKIAIRDKYTNEVITQSLNKSYTDDEYMTQIIANLNKG